MRKPKNRVGLKEAPTLHEIKPRMESSRRDLHVPPRSEWKGKSKNSSQYNKFLAKYDDLEIHIDKLNSQDLVFYFRQVAEENGQRYYIANMAKDAAIFKRLMENFERREICGMIEFLFTSEQDYLAKNRLSPNLLASQWVNTIYEDYKLWVDDKYSPNSSRQTKRQQHEWKNESSESRVGGWE